MTEYQIHETIPSGFSYADELQVIAFENTGSINGASKVCLVKTTGVPRLAFRPRPPHLLKNVESFLGRNSVKTIDEYRAEYERGWRNARRSSYMPSGSQAHDDGFLDGATGRPKWHLAHCTNHDECGEG